MARGSEYGEGVGGTGPQSMFKRHYTPFFAFFHLARAALRAISFLRSGERAFARAGPPFNPPSFPSICAALFLFMTAQA